MLGTSFVSLTSLSSLLSFPSLLLGFPSSTLQIARLCKTIPRFSVTVRISRHRVCSGAGKLRPLSRIWGVLRVTGSHHSDWQAALLWALVLTVAGARLEAQTTTLEASADTFVRSGSPNQAKGSDTLLRIQASGDNRALVRFDPAAIAAAVGSGSLASARLQLYIQTNADNWGAHGQPVDAVRLTADWTEAGATWNCGIDTIPSNSKVNCATQWAGGTFADEPSDTVLHTNGLAGWISFDVTADVQASLAGTPNYGWIVKKTDESLSGQVEYTSREGTAGQHPRLVLVVESPASDAVPPKLAIVAPALPYVTGTASPPIVLMYSDGGSGVDLGSLAVTLDGASILGSCTVAAATATCTPTALADGPHTVHASLSDHAGNGATADLSFTLLSSPGTHTATLPATGDSYLLQGSPNQPAGTATFLEVKKTGLHRALVQFNAAALSSALAGSTTLRSATLRLYLQTNGRNWGPTGRTVEAHRLTAPWQEPAVTWNCAADTYPTNNQPDCAAQWSGGSFAPAATASVLHTNSLQGWVEYDVTADVAAFLAGTPNYGWLLKKGDESLAGKADYTSREGIGGQGPQLVLVFDLPGSQDTVPPVLTITSPQAGYVATASPLIALTFSDAGTGVDLTTLQVSLDGADRTADLGVSASSAQLATTALADGPHTVTAAIKDLAGNRAQAALTFQIDSTAPALSFTAPGGPAVPGTQPLAIAIAYADARSGIDPATVQVALDGTDVTASCSIGAATASCSIPAPAEGGHALSAQVADHAGNVAYASLAVEVTLDHEPPALAFTAPASPLVTGNASPPVAVAYSDAASGVDPATLRVWIDATEITASCTATPGAAQCVPPPLTAGAHAARAQIADRQGNVASATLAFSVSFPVDIAFTAPAAGSVLAVPEVQVAGTVSPQAVSVTVNGVAAALSGGTFHLDTLGLHQGTNDVVAVALDAAGHVGTATVRVTADVIPPSLSVAYPAEGAVLAMPQVTVSGMVNDLTIGTVSSRDVTVTVNGAAAAVDNRSFLAPGVTLAPGANTITVAAEDRAGNRTSVDRHVTYQAPAAGSRALLLVGGDLQTAAVHSTLPSPLAVRLVDGTGLPVAAGKVVFRVVSGSGTLGNGRRSQVVTTDAQGLASAAWTLGSRAGQGSDRVRASSPGVLGDVIFSAVTTAAPAAAVDALSGNDQRGGVGTELALPLVAVLTDGNANPVVGAPVTFHVTQGGGSFGGADTVEVTTDASGLAAARLTLGPAPGFDNNWIEASFPGMSVLPAAFKASGFVLGEPAATAVSGVILDNQGLPVPGVTLRLRDSGLMTTSDAQGQFRLTGVPVGRIFLIADASTANLPGSWASLEYELFTLAGVDNTLVRPVYILPLDLAHGIAVDETHGGTVTLPGVPGFALDVAPGSVTFPGGSRSGTISVTAVHADKIPMAPGGGMQPRLIVTIQPAGARFDPPAAITFPNVDGLPPGSVTELFSFDHDLGAFVSIGTGTVSEDGLLLRSDPGFGVVQAGWHCGAPPSGNGDSATLTVSILNQKPVILCRGVAGQDPQQISALGSPASDIHYKWEIADPQVVTLNPVGDSLCHDQPLCATQATAGLLSGSGKTSARVSLVCELTGATSLDETEIDIPTVQVQSVDLCGDKIVTTLAPQSLSGTFTLSVVSGGAETVILTEARNGGTYTDHFNFDKLPPRQEFTNVRAKWKVKDCEQKAEKAAHFKSLGRIRHTSYNCPSSADPTCGGSSTSVCFTTVGQSCGYTPGTVTDTWLTQVTGPNHDGQREATGCGQVPGFGFVQIEHLCGNPPPGCASNRLFRSNSLTGTCRHQTLGPTTVAVPDLGALPCGSQLCILTNGGPIMKTVADSCPGCASDQIDDFSTATQCGLHDAIPSATTLQTFDN
jgi:hypothetical protein